MRCEQTRCILRVDARRAMVGCALAILNFSGVAEPGAQLEEERALVSAARGRRRQGGRGCGKAWGGSGVSALVVKNAVACRLLLGI
jgi:hypothetical protein